MLVFDIANQDFECLVDTLNRVEAMRLLDEIQMQALRGGLSSAGMEEINDEINIHRRKRRPNK